MKPIIKATTTILLSDDKFYHQHEDVMWRILSTDKSVEYWEDEGYLTLKTDHDSPERLIAMVAAKEEFGFTFSIVE